jgi:hypothetical protein
VYKNFIQYQSDKANEMVKTRIIYTPILNIKRSEVEKDHIVYGGLELDRQTRDGKIITAAKLIEGNEQNNTMEFAKNSMVTFAADIINMSEVCDLQLKIDPKYQAFQKEIYDEKSNKSIIASNGEKPKIYYVDTNKKLKLIQEIQEKSKGVYEIEKFPGDVYHDIIILYSVRLDQEKQGEYINVISVDGDSKNGEVVVKAGENSIANYSGELPDLF